MLSKNRLSETNVTPQVRVDLLTRRYDRDHHQQDAGRIANQRNSFGVGGERRRPGAMVRVGGRLYSYIQPLGAPGVLGGTTQRVLVRLGSQRRGRRELRRRKAYRT